MSELIAAIAGAAIGALATFAVALWVAREGAREQHYLHTDALDVSILKLYLDHPDFASPGMTAAYRTAFGTEGQRYSVFASLTHNFLETIFDLFFDLRTRTIHPQWERIFSHHAKLHLAWLLHEKNSCEPEYVDYVRQRFAAAQA
ncbi:MAG: hypothetical protein ACREHE_02900 [Rhizomicrobium sp.]